MNDSAQRGDACHAFVPNFTHDPARRSWVESANEPGDFPLQNLPLCVFRRAGEAVDRNRGGMAIGDAILDLKALSDLGLLSGLARDAAVAAASASLNRLMSMGVGASSALRAAVSTLLGDEVSGAVRSQLTRALVPMDSAQFAMPAQVGAFTDFFTSYHHADRAGRLSRPDRPVPPAFTRMPIGYNGRASSVVVSGTNCVRPNGHRTLEGPYSVGPSERMDFELEVGAFVGAGNPLGVPIDLRDAPEHLFGICLLNDWSARDLQKAESLPFGPFLAKSMCTSISPFVVTVEALAPFRTAPSDEVASAQVPDYLDPELDTRSGHYDVDLQALLVTPKMRAAGDAPVRITETNLKSLYWSFSQMLAHHTSNGGQMNPADLIGSGTVSGERDETRACLLEACLDLETGRHRPMTLPNGEARLWLEDGDEIILRGNAHREGFVSIGFGECRGTVAPAVVRPR